MSLKHLTILGIWLSDCCHAVQRSLILLNINIYKFGINIAAMIIRKEGSQAGGGGVRYFLDGTYAQKYPWGGWVQSLGF